MHSEGASMKIHIIPGVLQIYESPREIIPVPLLTRAQ